MSIGHGSMETDVLIAAWMLVLLERHSFEAAPAQLGSLGAAVRDTVHFPREDLRGSSAVPRPLATQP